MNSQTYPNAAAFLNASADSFAGVPFDPGLPLAVNALEGLHGVSNFGTDGAPLQSVVWSNLSDRDATEVVTLTAGDQKATAVPVPAGLVINNLSFNCVAGSTGATNRFAGLASVGASPVVLAVSADSLAVESHSATALTYALSEPYTVDESGVVWVFVCEVTAGEGATATTIAGAPLSSVISGTPTAGISAESVSAVPAVGTAFVVPTDFAAEFQVKIS